MRTFLVLTVLCGLSRAAWNPFGKDAAAAAPSPVAGATPSDPFGDSLLQSSIVPPPEPLAAQNPEGTTVPSTPSPQGVPPRGPTHIGHGVWDKILPGLLKPAPLAGTPYSGYEWRKGPIRFRPGLFQYEAIVLALGVAYILAIWAGRSANKARADAWSASVRDLLASQFARVEPLKAETATSYYIWATGRRNVRRGARIHIMLKPRGDVLMQAYEVIRGILEPSWTGASVDRVELQIPIESGGDYIVSVADKAAISRLREANWNLATFAPVSESTLLPPAYCVMSEVNAVQEALLRDKDLNLPALLASHKGRIPLLDNLTITDIVTDQPSEETLLTATPLPKDRRVTMSFQIGDNIDSNALISMVLNLVDMLAKNKPAMLDTTPSKVAKRRAEIVANLKKPLLEEQREDKAKKVAETKRLMEKERQAKLTPAQLQKEEERELRRKQRKQQQGRVRRM